MDQIKAELAPNGILRVGVNLANMLLVTDTAQNGDPIGVSPDMAAEIARRLGVGVSYETFASPGAVADAGLEDGWDICLIADEPKRAESISFTAAYVEIEGTYLVPEDSNFQTVEAVDSAGTRIAVSDRAAYDLYLTRSLKNATLHRAEGLPAAFELFKSGGFDALAGLRPALLENAKTMDGTRVVDGCYTSIQQALGTKLENTAGAAYLQSFVEEVTSNGFVERLLYCHGVNGKLQVAKGLR
jgi:polar amino acid transport system substrate-binding protein|tara:strand:- start:868 stop:1596 length:729 start_codon:yes stop_codon:yes gene_type:complete